MPALVSISDFFFVTVIYGVAAAAAATGLFALFEATETLGELVKDY